MSRAVAALAGHCRGQMISSGPVNSSIGFLNGRSVRCFVQGSMVLDKANPWSPQALSAGWTNASGQPVLTPILDGADGGCLVISDFLRCLNGFFHCGQSANIHVKLKIYCAMHAHVRHGEATSAVRLFFDGHRTNQQGCIGKAPHPFRCGNESSLGPGHCEFLDIRSLLHGKEEKLG